MTAPPDVLKLTVDADYFQYAVTDGRVVPDWGLATEVSDGLLAPMGTGVSIATGRYMGPIIVTVHFAEPGPFGDPADVIRSQVTIEVPSGEVTIGRLEDPRHLIHYPGPVIIAIRATVYDRNIVAGGGESIVGAPPERHVLDIWPVDGMQDRQYSRAQDEFGRHMCARPYWRV